MPASAGEHALEERSFAADRQRGRDARLQHRVALDDAPARRVEPRPIERMRHLADQAPHRVARQPRVGIERDDIAHIRRRPAVADRRRPTKVVSVAPRSSRFSSWSLPRLRSHPIQLLLRLRSTHAGGAAEEALPRRQPVRARRLSRAIPSRAASQQRRVAVGVRSRRRSSRTASAKCTSPSGAGEVVNFETLDLLSMASRVVSSVGTATMVRRCAGTPSRSARPGSIVAPNRE